MACAGNLNSALAISAAARFGSCRNSSLIASLTRIGQLRLTYIAPRCNLGCTPAIAAAVRSVAAALASARQAGEANQVVQILLGRCAGRPLLREVFDERRIVHSEHAVAGGPIPRSSSGLDLETQPPVCCPTVSRGTQLPRRRHSAYSPHKRRSSSAAC